jgi:CheY-like chemotaxis protein
MDQTRHTVLVVDDNPDLLELLLEGLSSQFTVRLARDGAEGLESVGQTHPDCAIVDVKMPGLDGWQLVRALRGDPETQDIPLIVLSAMPEDQGLLPSLLTGADRFLTKPVLPSELVQAIHEVLAIDEQDRKQRMRSLAEEGDWQ